MAKVVEKRRAAGKAGAKGGASGGRALPWAAAAVLLALVAVWWWAAARSESSPLHGGAAAHRAAVQNLNEDDRRQQAAGGAPRPQSELKLTRQDTASGQQQGDDRRLQADDSKAETVAKAADPASVPPSEWRKFLPPTGFSGGPVEGFLCMMAGAAAEGGSLPPMPLGSEEELLREFARAATNEVIIFEDDPPDVVRLKEDVAAMKAQLAEIVENGGSIRETLLEYEAWAAESQERRREVSTEFKRLRDEEGEEAAEEYLAAANAELEAEGVAPVNLGRNKKRDRSRIDARLKAMREAQEAALRAREEQKGNASGGM